LCSHSEEHRIGIVFASAFCKRLLLPTSAPNLVSRVRGGGIIETSPLKRLKEDTMKAEVGDRIVVEAEKVGQSTRTGVIEEVLAPNPPRLRVRWDDGHSTVFAPTAGAATIEPASR
jgi:Domain of unknown function (DUF1918)